LPKHTNKLRPPAHREKPDAIPAGESGKKFSGSKFDSTLMNIINVLGVGKCPSFAGNARAAGKLRLVLANNVNIYVVLEGNTTAFQREQVINKIDSSLRRPRRSDRHIPSVGGLLNLQLQFTGLLLSGSLIVAQGNFQA
jgi:hypothetical protein